MISSTTPMQKTTEQAIMAILRPQRFVTGQMMKQPARAPACWMPTAMELTLVSLALLKANDD
jgi:hypothetical protein